MHKLSKQNAGFSLIELIIAIALSVMVSGIIIALISVTSNSMARTKSKVALQSQANIAMNHMINMVQKASDVSFDSTHQIAIVTNKTKAGHDEEKVVYWEKDNGLYYACPYVDPTSVASTDLPKYLLANNVKNLELQTQVNAMSGKISYTIKMNFENDKATFDINHVVVPRNR